MEKSPGTAKFSVMDNNLSWAYQEIALEAFFVILICVKVSTEFAMRFFPQWSENSVDPGMKNSYSFIEVLLQQDSDPCFWSRVVSHWKLLENDPCQNNTVPFPTPDAVTTCIGCIVAVTTLGATTALFISFLWFLIANRRWRLPRIRGPVPCLSQIYAWMRDKCGGDANEQHNQSGEDCDIHDQETEPDAVKDTAGKQGSTALNVEELEFVARDHDMKSQDVNVSVEHSQISSSEKHYTRGCRCRIMLDNLATALIDGACFVLSVIFSIPLLPLAVGIWVIMVCPVLILAAMIVRGAAVLFGEETMFSVYAISVCLLAIYCTGRIWGLWMSETYYNAARRIFKQGRGLKDVEDLTEPQELSERMACYPDQVMLEWLCGCAMMWMTVCPLVCREYPYYDFSFDWFPMFNRRLQNTTQNWSPSDSMLSHWVDVYTCFGNVSTFGNVPILSLPVVLPEIKALGTVWTAWSAVLTVVNFWPVHLVLLIEVIALVCIAPVVFGWECYWHCRTRQESTSLSKPWRNGMCKSSIIDLCGEPAGHLNAFRYVLTAIRSMVTWIILPALTVQYFLPEKYQLPGTLLMITYCTVWNYYVAAPAFWKLLRLMHSSCQMKFGGLAEPSTMPHQDAAAAHGAVLSKEQFLDCGA